MQKKYSFFLLLLLFFVMIHSVLAKSNLTYELHGVSGEILDNINARLLSAQSQYGGHLTDATVKKLYLNGSAEIKKALEPYGFFKSNVVALLSRSNGQWRAIYYIKLGPPLLITSVTIKVTGEGKNNEKIWKAIKKYAPKALDVLNIPAYNHFKTKLFQRSRNQGYLQSYFSNKILININQSTCYITIILNTGKQFYFGPVTFKTFPYSEQFMRRFITFKPGEVFSSKKILTLQQQMESSYYFKQAIFKVNFKKIDDLRVPIDAYLYPPSAQSYSLGAGYGTLTGPRLSAGMSLRHLGNEGHHLEAEAKLSSVLTGIGATYYIPGQNPLTDEWLIGANYKRFSPKAGESDSFTLTGGYSKEFKYWQTNFNLNYLLERFIIYSEPPHQRAHLLYPSFKATYTKTDNLISPNNGFSFNVVVQGSSDVLLSSTRFASIQTRLKYLVSPFSFGRILLRADAGAIDVHHLTIFPLSLRFFAGGVNSIRGFGDSSIGPGKYLGIASAEYQQRIKGDFFAAIFYDIGNAANHVSEPLNRGAGIGAVYDTRVGPIKLYVAQALSKKTKPYSLEFSVGPEFS